MSKTTPEQIVATLRCCSDHEEVGKELECCDCAFADDCHRRLIFCSKQLFDAAADLIEKQEARIRELEARVNAERWHDLEENPEDTPEDEQDVLCLVEYTRYGDRPGKAKRMDVGYYINGRWGGPAIQGQSARICKWRKVEHEEAANE